MKSGVIIQARMSSERLPGKVLLPLPHGSSICVLEHVIRRAQQVDSISKVIVATSDQSEDDRIAEVAQQAGAGVYRGSLEHVLSRFYHVAQSEKLEYILRFTADNPLTDPGLASQLLEACIQQNLDYVSFDYSEQLPVGVASEVFSSEGLSIAYNRATDAVDIEHVTPFIRNWSRQRQTCKHLSVPQDLRVADLRLTLDTLADYTLFCALFALDRNMASYTTGEIINVFERFPWLQQINAQVYQKQVFSSQAEEFRTAVQWLYKQDMPRAAKYLKKVMETDNAS